MQQDPWTPNATPKDKTKGQRPKGNKYRTVPLALKAPAPSNGGNQRKQSTDERTDTYRRGPATLASRHSTSGGGGSAGGAPNPHPRSLFVSLLA
ncbi:hypothetical protein NL676_024906 [Syzygium grande]|nr:hypothetical protein NL676_024906 [Syzygium grande]